MSRERPVAVRAVIDRSDPRTAFDPTDRAGEHDEDLRDAAWLYAWSHAALRPSARPSSCPSPPGGPRRHAAPGAE